MNGLNIFTTSEDIYDENGEIAMTSQFIYDENGELLSKITFDNNGNFLDHYG